MWGAVQLVIVGFQGVILIKVSSEMWIVPSSIFQEEKEKEEEMVWEVFLFCFLEQLWQAINSN